MSIQEKCIRVGVVYLEVIMVVVEVNCISYEYDLDLELIPLLTKGFLVGEEISLQKYMIQGIRPKLINGCMKILN